DAGRRPDQDDIGTADGEQAVGHDADDVVDARLELGRIQDAQIGDVEDHVAVVGDEACTQLGVSAELDQFVRHMALGYRDHFDRQRKVAEHADQLGLVDDAYVLRGDRGDDLFPRQRAAAAFDHRAVGGGFIGPVDIHGQ